MNIPLKALLPLLIFIGLVCAFGFGLTKDPSSLPSQLINKPFPPFSLSSLDDEDVMLDASVLNEQTSIVNVFGSWCAACEYEHGMLMSIAQNGHVPIIGIDWRDDRVKGMAWLAKLGNPYTAVIFDPDSVLAIPLGVTGAPESFIVDRTGQIRYKFVGPITAQVWRGELSPLIATINAEPTP